RRLHNILSLIDAVLPLRVQNVRYRKPVIEHPVPSAQRVRRLLRSEVPRKPQARRYIAVVRDLSLILVTQPATQREVRFQLPVILKEKSHVRHAGDGRGIPRSAREQARPSALRTNLLRSQSLLQ